MPCVDPGEAEPGGACGLQPSSRATAMSLLSNTATSAAVRPPTLWVPLWSSAVTLATRWSRAPSSLSVSTPTIPSGMRQSLPAEVSERSQNLGLQGPCDTSDSGFPWVGWLPALCGHPSGR